MGCAGSGQECAAAVVTLALGGVLTPAVAQADAAPLNAAAAYAVNVPGDVLASAGTTRTTAALAASNQTYDWKLADPKFGQVSSAVTRYPSAPSTTLTPAEQLEWESLTSRFAAPATKAATLTRYVKGAGLPLIALQTGLLIGQGSSGMLGFKDDMVCAERNEALTVAASVLDGVDCSA